jgi:hypothetical protein
MTTLLGGRRACLVQSLRAGLLYFALVFGTGFVLGPIRILWVVPRLGTRWAELMELPVMLIVTILAAGWFVRRFALSPAHSVRLGMGFFAVVLTVPRGITLVLKLRGLSIGEYLVTRDPASGTAYYLMLVVFAVMPLLVARK